MTDTVTLASPMSLPCGATLKNRLVKAAMTEGVADTHNRATSRHATLYSRFFRVAPQGRLIGEARVTVSVMAADAPG